MLRPSTRKAPPLSPSTAYPSAIRKIASASVTSRSVDSSLGQLQQCAAAFRSPLISTLSALPTRVGASIGRAIRVVEGERRLREPLQVVVESCVELLIGGLRVEAEAVQESLVFTPVELSQRNIGTTQRKRLHGCATFTRRQRFIEQPCESVAYASSHRASADRGVSSSTALSSGTASSTRFDSISTLAIARRGTISDGSRRSAVSSARRARS